MSTLQLESTQLDEPIHVTDEERIAAALAISTQPDRDKLARMIGLTK
ncbi:hypothetical protein [Arthrobacter sp. VKM Ac-2550]|nr:hypothetical protein [Arthrobacter sp. VKM Ac-2550]MCW2132932.1 hypothetical protein [Arthrobacter sp. VKM Ac-2550]